MSFDRALSLARYNWPLYAVSCASILVGIAVASITSLSGPLRIIALFGAAVAAWYTLASFSAFHAMFDRSGFLSGRWLKECPNNSPKVCLQLSVCLEETTLPIDQIFPEAECINLDLFDQSVMTEPAVKRAREASRLLATQSASPDSLPLQDQFCDLAVATLAAHEVRERRLRESLFRELNRVTKPEGRVVIIEHLRNLAAFFAFGPGLFHFYPRDEWMRLAETAQLSLESEFNITPFIHVFVFGRISRGT